MKKTKPLTAAALMAALCVAILAIGSIVESLDLSLAVIAGLVVMICATEYGDRIGLAVFAVSAVLSMLLPMRSGPLCFLVLFGWYPIAQKKLHQLPPVLCRVVKTVIFNAALILVLALSAFLTGLETKLIYGILLVLGNLMFVLYDILLDRFLIWYILKIRPRMKL